MRRDRSETIRLLVIFAIAMTLSTFPNSSRVPVVRASPAPIEVWYPAGPAMNTELIQVFQDKSAEFSCLLQPTPCVDLTDSPLTPSMQGIATNPNYYVTPKINHAGYFETQFNLRSNYWGCPMDFGNSKCGLEIRQGIAHLIDKQIFATAQGDISGFAVPLDNPVPYAARLNSVNLVTPLPCSWDTIAPNTPGAPRQIAPTGGNPSGPQCVVGANGGVAYHLAGAASFTGQQFPWQVGPGSPDFCAAAFHFIIAGLATGFDPTTCVLTGLSTAVTSGANPVNLFARVDDNPRYQLGQGLAESMCALFTGAFANTQCKVPGSTTLDIVTFTPGTDFSSPFLCLVTSCGAFQIYTGAFDNVFPWDKSLYFTYDSRFVDAAYGSVYQRNGGHCSNQASNSSAASNYMYLCVPAYDRASNALETAPCLNAPGDPVVGMTIPTYATCPTALTNDTAITATYKALDLFGHNAFTLPVIGLTTENAYLSNWQRVINDAGEGIPNFFTWLDAYSSNPAVPGTIRQGFRHPTTNLDPWFARNPWDLYVTRNIYDSLGLPGPLKNGPPLDWLTIDSVSRTPPQLGYVPPAGTALSYRFTLRYDIFWQDHHPLTAWDVKFSYASLLAAGAFQSAGISSMVCNISTTCADGITVLSPTQFDVHVSSSGPFQQFSIVGPTILPGRYWSSCQGTAWDSAVAAGSVSDSCMAPIAGGQDPVKTGIMIGSGPWECISTGTGGFPAGTLGGGCTSSGDGRPPPGGTITLQRFGQAHPPGTSMPDTYFRSNGNLALWIWSGNNGDSVHDFLLFGIISRCFNQPSAPLNGIPLPTSCAHWQQGIGANGGPTAVGSVQIGIVLRFNSVNWIKPYDWVTNPPVGIAAFPPTILEGQYRLIPASVAGCSVAYPTGGYDG